MSGGRDGYVLYAEGWGRSWKDWTVVMSER